MIQSRSTINGQPLPKETSTRIGSMLDGEFYPNQVYTEIGCRNVVVKGLSEKWDGLPKFGFGEIVRWQYLSLDYNIEIIEVDSNTNHESGLIEWRIEGRVV